MVKTLKTVSVMLFLQNAQLILAPKKFISFNSLSLKQNLKFPSLSFSAFYFFLSI